MSGRIGKELIARMRHMNDSLEAIMASESDSPQTDCPYVTGKTTRYCTLTPFTLTDAERFVLREVCAAYADRDDVAANEIAAVIDRLLERTR